MVGSADRTLRVTVRQYYHMTILGVAQGNMGTIYPVWCQRSKCKQRSEMFLPEARTILAKAKRSVYTQCHKQPEILQQLLGDSSFVMQSVRR